jgi:RNA polymerase sigma factor (sigma-70 family)
LEASTLTHSGRLGLLGRRSRLLKLQGDERLIAMMRAGHERAFEALIDRYHVRLLAFCRGMLASAEDAEDVLQEVYVAAHKAILADNRAINARPWLYRIARNRCLNHLRKPVPEGQDSMDVHPHENGTSVAEKVQKRAEFRALILDVQGLPETQRSALLLRELDALSYEEIAIAMDTTVPAVKSLLVRARMSLADASQGRHLTCGEVHLELAEAAEGLRKVSGPARFHMKDCGRCRDYRSELRRNNKALAALVPIGPVAAIGHALASKLGIGGAKAGAGSSAGASAGAGVGAGGAGAGAAGTGVTGAAAAGGGSALGIAGTGAAGIGAGALGAKAAAGMASMVLLTAGAVEVQHITSDPSPVRPPGIEQNATAMVGPADRAVHGATAEIGAPAPAPAPAPPADPPPAEPPVNEAPAEPEPAPAPSEPTPAPEPPAEEPADDAVVGDPDSGGGTVPTNPGDSDGVIVPGDPPPIDPPAEAEPAGAPVSEPEDYGRASGS